MSIRAEQAVVHSSPLPPRADAPSASPPRGRFADVFQNLAARVDQGEGLVSRALRGGGGAGLEPGQWIALQAGIYRYVEAVDLAGKLVDRTGTAIRTVLQAGH
jgi:hypothetical protein